METYEVTLPQNEREARDVLIMVGSKAEAIVALTSLATEVKELAQAARDLRKHHDTLLSVRNMIKHDCEDIAPLRATRNSKDEDDDDTDGADSSAQVS
jgi:hypothetical protein